MLEISVLFCDRMVDNAGAESFQNIIENMSFATSRNNKAALVRIGVIHVLIEVYRA
jgi:hypothetical protein